MVLGVNIQKDVMLRLRGFSKGAPVDGALFGDSWSRSGGNPITLIKGLRPRPRGPGSVSWESFIANVLRGHNPRDEDGQLALGWFCVSALLPHPYCRDAYPDRYINDSSEWCSC